MPPSSRLPYKKCRNVANNKPFCTFEALPLTRTAPVYKNKPFFSSAELIFTFAKHDSRGKLLVRREQVRLLKVLFGFCLLGCSGGCHVDGNRARPLTPVHEDTTFLWLDLDRLQSYITQRSLN